MDQIYQSASQVLVWLGPDIRDDACKVQQLMRKLARWHDEVRFDEVLEAQVGGTVFTAMEVVRDAGLPGFGAEDLLDWTCFVRFFRRRWFFRTWTVQELALGQEVRFFCSGTEFPWSDITKCCSILGNTTLGTTLGSTFLQDHLQRSHATGCFQKGAPIPGAQLTSALSLYWECRQNPSGHFEVPKVLRRWCFRISGQATSTQNISALLSWFLYATWEQQASDPRDKVYGILGMVSAAARLQSLRVPTIEVDYSKPVESVFSEVAAFVLGKTNCLGYLAFVQDPSGRTLPQLPSWVPNFDYNSRISSLLFEDSEQESYFDTSNCYQAGINKSPFSIRHNILHCRGYKIGSVTGARGPLARLSNEALSSKDDQSTFLNDLAKITLKCADVYLTGQSRVEVLWRTLIADTYDRAHPASPQLATHFRYWIVGRLLHAHKVITGRSFDKDYHDTAYPHVEELARSDASKIVPGTQELLEYAREKELDEDAFFQKMLRETYAFILNPAPARLGRSFFITSNGQMCLGSESVERGDSVWILAGGATPFVLREAPKVATGAGELKSCCMTFIEETYVHGIMHGEALKGRDILWQDIAIS